MRVRGRLALALLLLGGACTAPTREQAAKPTAAEIAALCQTQPCREAGSVEVQVGGDQTVSETIPSPEPFILNDTISIRPGELLVVEARIMGSQLRELLVQKGAPTAAPILIFEFEQGAADRVLTIKNSFDHAIKFHIDMRFVGSDEWYQTTSCPLGPSPGGGTPFWTNVEHWQDPIAELKLSDFRLVDLNSVGACGY